MLIFVYKQIQMNFIFSRKKLFNTIQILYGYCLSNIFKRPFKIGLPTTLSIEPVNFCNLSCPECPAGNGSITREKKAMEFDLFRKIICEIKDYTYYLTLYFQGEPFLHPQFIKFIQFSNEHQIYTASSTNAQFIDDEMAKKIIESGLNKLIVSLDGSTQEVYEKYRIGGSFSKAKDCISFLVKWKKSFNSSSPFIELQFLVLKHNEHQIREIKKLSKNLNANKLRLKSAQITNFKEGSDLLPTQKRYARYIKSKDGDYKRKEKIKNRCWRAFSGAVIAANGDVLPCSFDKNGEHAFGNINEKSLAEIWHNEKAHSFRKQILKNKKEFEMCKNCTM